MDATKRPLQIPPGFSTYAEKHGIFQLLERLLQKIIITQPDDPLAFMTDFLKQDNDDVHKIVVQGPPVSGKRQIAIEYLHENQHIPSNILVPILEDRLRMLDCQNKASFYLLKYRGWLLEGFPQNREQALAMQVAGIMPKHFVLLDAPDAVLVERCLGKRIDPITGDVYHILFYPPDDALVADRLEQQQNYNTDDVSSRLAIFQRHIDGIIECYNKVSKKINADQPIGDVFAQVLSFLCTKSKSNSPFTPRVVLLGPTGSGKSTQADLLSKKYQLINVCVDSLVKEAIVKQSKAGNGIKLYLDRGVAAPDALMFQLVKERLCQLDCIKKGWVLHGYPRTREQAVRMAEIGLEPNRVFALDIPTDSILERLSLRGTDPITGARYHMHYNPPRTNEIASRLRTHPDDTEDAIMKRLSAYQIFIDDICEFYGNTIKHINADQDPHTIFESLEAGIVSPLPVRPDTPF
ncbi:uncharacterized protein TRIADDRAFT_53152 [Trichoplax adhaerens]|uniref:Adenylate kinase n=1 Tax=Trichoplax adhaerens TaxID=10228 RepID=B3RNF9_TRIAD|nr:hypothetical protein TRIADDRAFT_53152 [Trichoplax adhaerens]EDV27446.1 hypothetical protein TRIADDRAFT_53152 [Trichoplax adhaerens]|eukprot:XP_002109280.1 hypothetical protein TRIADDRAFT_53152 [Trichoplax adhaerens]